MLANSLWRSNKSYQLFIASLHAGPSTQEPRTLDRLNDPHQQQPYHHDLSNMIFWIYISFIKNDKDWSTEL